MTSGNLKPFFADEDEGDSNVTQTTCWPTKDSTVVGAMTTWSGGAAFDRAPLVLARADAPSRRLVVHRYLDDDAEGVLASDEEWSALQQSGEAMGVTWSVPAMPGAWLWLLRRHLPLDRGRAVDELRRRGMLLGLRVRGPGDAWACVVVEPASTADVREGWATVLARLGRLHVRRGDWDLAERAADAAFDVEPRMTVPRAALLARVLLLHGRTAAAEDVFSAVEAAIGPTAARMVERRARRS